MFKCNEFIYIQMQKTGCTHIASLLCKLFKGEMIGKHNAATPEQLKLIHYFISSIRNPWEWYLSLWAFGVQGGGGFMRRLTNRQKSQSFVAILNNPNQPAEILTNDVLKWRSVYERVDDVERFRLWLKLIHAPDNSEVLRKIYGNTTVINMYGFMTYRYLNLCCKNIEQLHNSEWISGFSKLEKFDKNNCYIDYFIRQEALEDTLCEAIEHVRPITQQDRVLIYGAKKTNASVKLLSTSDYYDRESIDLIQERDRLIIEKFGYTPPN